MMVFVKEPRMADSTFSHVLSPFNSGVWRLFSLLLAFLILLLSTTSHVYNNIIPHGDPEPYNILHSYTFTLGVFCQQGYHASPRSRSCRVLCMTAYLTAVFLLGVYFATFVSFLMVRKLDLPFTDFEGMLQDGTFKIELPHESGLEYYFKHSRNPVLREVHRELIAPYEQDSQGTENLCTTTRTAYFTSDLMVRYMAPGLPCKMVGLPHTQYPITTSYIVCKNSPYKRVFNHYIQEMKETGILRRLDIISKPLTLTEMVDDTPPSVTLETVTVFFMILLSGIIISTIILVIEIIFEKSKLYM